MSTAKRDTRSVLVTKAEFEAGLKALEERLTERFENLLFAQQAKGALVEFDRISDRRDTNPFHHAEEDVSGLTREVRAETASKR